MSVLHADEWDLDELARQTVLQDYQLPYGAADGSPVDRVDYQTPPELLDLVKLAVRVSGMDAGVINIITADQQHQIAAVGVDASVCSRDDSMCSKVFTSGSITALADASLDPRFADNPFVNGRIADVRSYASVPLVTRSGHAAEIEMRPAVAEVEPTSVQTLREIRSIHFHEAARVTTTSLSRQSTRLKGYICRSPIAKLVIWASG